VVALAALAVTACQTEKAAFNPLDNYKQLNPATSIEPPAAAPNGNFAPEQVERGKYLVGLLGCGSCHTNGALVGVPNMQQLLAGSDTGIAWSNPLVNPNPGIVYPANLTPDIETGIGSWSLQDITRMIQTGFSKHNGQSLAVMPWPSYANIHGDDVTAIAAYLKSLPPVKHKVPVNVRAGQKASAPFVHFGVYQSK
jgi:hypothetical protein